MTLPTDRIVEQILSTVPFDAKFAAKFRGKVFPIAWLTKQGERIYVWEMDDYHLVCCISKIKREQWRMPWLPILEAELNWRIQKQSVWSVA